MLPAVEIAVPPSVDRPVVPPSVGVEVLVLLPTNSDDNTPPVPISEADVLAGVVPGVSVGVAVVVPAGLRPEHQYIIIITTF